VDTAQRRAEESRVPATAEAVADGRLPPTSLRAKTWRDGPAAAGPIGTLLRTGNGDMRRRRMRTAGTGPRGKQCRQPLLARTDAAVSLSRMSRAVRGKPTLLRAPSRPGTACLLWNSPSWKMRARDERIAWSDVQRRQNLQAIVNNGRFLVLPWVQVKGLASKILALSARQMPHDWENPLRMSPLLLETLVDAGRFRGTCYRAANWIHLGQTTGRGRMDRHYQAHGHRSKTSTSIPSCTTRSKSYAVISHGKQIRPSTTRS
jgi:hypothetical protein